MKKFIQTKGILCLLIIGSSVCKGQNWNKNNSFTPNNNVTDEIWRSGAVLISDSYKNPYNNFFGVTAKYKNNSNRAAYFSLNEPDNWYNTNGDSTRVGLVTDSLESHTSLVVANYANFYDSINSLDVHNSTAEFNYVRGMSDALGFRDGGRLAKSAVLKLSGTFSNNQRTYSNGEFDLLNLRFFTDSKVNSLAVIDDFYGIRLENFRGVNSNIIQNGWGIYIQPEMLKNYFAGNLGVGSTNPTHKLTVKSNEDPLKIVGLQPAVDQHLLSIDTNGVVHKVALDDIALQNPDTGLNFLSVSSDISLVNDYDLYVHKGTDAIYTLPHPSSRAGKVWKIINVGSGKITFSVPFLEGDETRSTLLNKAGNYSVELFSDGTQYIALK